MWYDLVSPDLTNFVLSIVYHQITLLSYYIKYTSDQEYENEFWSVSFWNNWYVAVASIHYNSRYRIDASVGIVRSLHPY